MESKGEALLVGAGRHDGGGQTEQEQQDMLVERLEWFMEIGDRKVREGGAIVATCECECAPLTVFTLW